MTQQAFTSYLRAAYPALWVVSHEEQRAIAELSGQAQGYLSLSYDIVNELINTANGQPIEHKGDQLGPPQPDPLAALKWVRDAAPDNTLLFFMDGHKMVDKVEFYRLVKSLLPHFRSSSKHIIFISPINKIPVELSKDITLFDFELPSLDQIEKAAANLLIENGITDPVDRETLSAAKGLTMSEVEDCLALSIISKGKISREVLESEKLQIIKKSGLMELYAPEPAENLGGLEPLKTYIKNRKKGFSDPALPTPKGILLVGLPGAGKSLSAKVIASMLDWPLIRLDLSALKGGIVGQTEENTRTATAQIDAIGQSVVWIDEIDKALGGVASSNRTDGGTSSAMFGHLLTWMQESTSDKLIVATCNNINDLLAISQGALLRRFDDIFFCDLPSKSERREILSIMNRRYGTSYDVSMADKMDNFTGAEIEKWVKSAIYDGPESAFKSARPIFNQSRQAIDACRTWAKQNALTANTVEEKKIDIRQLNLN